MTEPVTIKYKDFGSKRKHDGFYYPQSHRIEIHSKLTAPRELVVTVHELLHACASFMDEDAVERCGAEIGTALWEAGYRKVKL